MFLSRANDFFITLRAKLNQTVRRALELMAVLAFLGFFFATLIQVLGRYVAHYSLVWTEEFSILLYVGMVCLGAAIAVDEYPRLTLGIDFVKRRSILWYKLLTIFIDGISLIVLYYILLGSYSRTMRGWTNFLPATGFRWAYFYLPFLVASAVLIAYTLLNICTTVLLLAQKKEEDH